MLSFLLLFFNDFIGYGLTETSPNAHSLPMADSVRKIGSVGVLCPTLKPASWSIAMVMAMSRQTKEKLEKYGYEVQMS